MKPKLILIPFVLLLVSFLGLPSVALAQSPAPSSGKKPNILVIFGDDIGQTNVSAYSMGVMGYKTPKIDRLAKEGARRWRDCKQRVDCRNDRRPASAHTWRRSMA